MYRYNTFWSRFWAGFVDGLVLLPLGLIDSWLLVPSKPVAIVLGWAALSYSLYWLYSVILHARCGQTLGKMATGVKVLDVSEQSIPSLRQAFLRDIGPIAINSFAFLYLVQLVLNDRFAPGAAVNTIPAMILGVAAMGWFLLEIITMLTNPKRRALHDFIAGTVVVKDQ